MTTRIDLGTYDNGWYSPGRSNLWRAAWLFVGLPLFRAPLLPFSGLRVALLRLFGARVGRRVVIHSEVVVKYPWHLQIGEHCWIGERAWIDNLTTVRIGNNVCISQGCYICTGNHDWTDPSFGLIVRSVELQDGAWAGAMSTLLPGVTLGEGAVAAAGSVVAQSIPPYEVHNGNPAVFARTRHVREARAHHESREQVAQ